MKHPISPELRSRYRGDGEFKQEVVSEIHNALNSNSIYIKVVGVKNLRYEGSRDFSAVVIINRALAGRPDPRVESYIDKE